MKRDSRSSIIPKIILILGTLSVFGIILLFFRPRGETAKRSAAPEAPEELFSQVIAAATPEVLKLWEEGDRTIGKNPPNCPDEIAFNANVGRSYYQCQPHLWQCYWEGKVRPATSLKVDLFGQTFHVEAKASFPAIPAYSKSSRYYQMIKHQGPGPNLHYGYVVELMVRELPGFSQPVILTDTCRDTYLPQRLYPYGKVKNRTDEGFIWDNYDRKIFIDKFYVSVQQVNEWRLLTGDEDRVDTDRKRWPTPALLGRKEQKLYCAYFGKRPLEAHLFDAATMTPADVKQPMPDRILRPQTPWMRDLSKSFLGTARVNGDYQLTPLDCQLAQVQNCPLKLYTTDSATWMGMNYALGFYPEALVNSWDPDMDLKLSSRLLSAHSEWHELGARTNWNGKQEPGLPVAFRCYEEVSQ